VNAVLTEQQDHIRQQRARAADTRQPWQIPRRQKSHHEAARVIENRSAEALPLRKEEDTFFLTGVATDPHRELTERYATLLFKGWECELCRWDYVTALDHYKGARQIASQLCMRLEQGLAVHLMGNCLKIMAVSISRRMRPYKSKLGFSDYGTSDTRCVLGDLRADSEQDHSVQEKKADTWLREAEACQQQALKLASTETEFADTSLQARALKGLGVCLHARCEYDAAFQLHRRALQLSQRMTQRDDELEARIHANLGNTLRALGRDVEALVHYKYDLAASLRAKSNVGQVVQRRRLGWASFTCPSISVL